MKSLDSLLSSKSTALTAQTETPASLYSSAKSAEPFDQMMNRALASPAREPAPKPSTLKKPASNSGPERKSKTSTGANSSTESAPASTKVSVRESTQEKCSDGSSSEDSESSSGSGTDKEPTKTAADSTDVSSAAALQAMAASAMANQTAVTVPDIAKTAKAAGEVDPVAMVGAELSAETSAQTESAVGTSENSNDAAKTDLKSETKDKTGAGKKVSSTGASPAKMSGPNDGAIPIAALRAEAQKEDETPVNTPNPAPAKAHTTGAETAGTSAAQQAATMKNADQAKDAAAPEQSLPGVTVASAAQAAIRTKPAVKAAARVESSDAPTSTTSAAVERPPTTVETSSSNLISASSQTELRARALDRTHDMLALHGMQLRQTNTDSLHVVIKPGAGMQLSLQMKQTSDGIEAQATLQQGNFNDLNKHWAELQQRLEERGIKLAPLGQDGSATNTGGENFQRPSHQSAEQNSLSAGAFAEFASAGTALPRPVSEAVVASRGWESWA